MLVIAVASTFVCHSRAKPLLGGTGPVEAQRPTGMDPARAIWEAKVRFPGCPGQKAENWRLEG